MSFNSLKTQLKLKFKEKKIIFSGKKDTKSCKKPDRSEIYVLKVFSMKNSQGILSQFSQLLS